MLKDSWGKQRLQADVDVVRLQLASSDEVISEAVDLCDRWSKLRFEEKRQIIETILDRIAIDDEEITVHLAYLPAPPDGTFPPPSKDGANTPQTVRGSPHRRG
jgi:hypothetical protein